MTFKELRESSKMTRAEFAQYFHMPYRTVQCWELYGISVEGRKCPEYLFDLILYKLQKEGFIKE